MLKNTLESLFKAYARKFAPITGGRKDPEHVMPDADEITLGYDHSETIEAFFASEDYHELRKKADVLRKKAR